MSCDPRQARYCRGHPLKTIISSKTLIITLNKPTGSVFNGDRFILQTSTIWSLSSTLLVTDFYGSSRVRSFFIYTEKTVAELSLVSSRWIITACACRNNPANEPELFRGNIKNVPNTWARFFYYRSIFISITETQLKKTCTDLKYLMQRKIFERIQF